MSVVNVRIAGKDYQIACDDGQEEQLRLLADEVDERVRSLIYRMGSNPGEGMGLLLTALTMADELIENKKEIDRLHKDNRQLVALVNEDHSSPEAQDSRLADMESAMSETLEQVALRIEKIADQLEIR